MRRTVSSFATNSSSSSTVVGTFSRRDARSSTDTAPPLILLMYSASWLPTIALNLTRSGSAMVAFDASHVLAAAIGPVSMPLPSVFIFPIWLTIASPV